VCVCVYVCVCVRVGEATFLHALAHTLKTGARARARAHTHTHTHTHTSYLCYRYHRLFSDVLNGGVGFIHAMNVSLTLEFATSGIQVFAFRSFRASDSPASDSTNATLALVLINIAADQVFDVSIHDVLQDSPLAPVRQSDQQSESAKRPSDSIERPTLRPVRPARAPSQRFEWHMRGDPDVTSTDVTINGHAMKYPGDGPRGMWNVHNLATSVDVSAPVVVQPSSVVFVAM
jgi:hypothetical protein